MGSEPLSLEEVEKLVTDVDCKLLDTSQLIGAEGSLKPTLEKLTRFVDYAVTIDKSNHGRTRAEPEYRSHASMLIFGETGTGKGDLFRELGRMFSKRLSRRCVRPIIERTFNCGRLPSERDRAISELFGHVRGAYNGAVQNRQGFFRDNEGNCVLLDELQELPIEIQTLLNDLVQDGAATPLGSETKALVDIICVFAVNKSPAELVLAAKLNPDLYYRICPYEIELLPLRERRSEIPEFVRYFLAGQIHLSGAEVSTKLNTHFTSHAIQSLVNHDWHGNVREIRSVIERLFHYQINAGDTVDVDHVNAAFTHLGRAQSNHTVNGAPTLQPTSISGEAQGEKKVLNDASLLKMWKSDYEGETTKAQMARDLGMNPDTLRKALNRAGAKKGRQGAPGARRPPKRSSR